MGVGSPSPSDVLADQLRIRADLEREEALKRVAANKAKHASPPAKGSGGVSGPSVASLEQPIVSGSLLTGAGRRSSRGSTGPPLSSASESAKPIFETLSDRPPPAVAAGGGVQEGHGPVHPLPAEDAEEHYNDPLEDLRAAHGAVPQRVRH